MTKGYHVAVVGATGAVGQQMLQTLENRNFPISKLTLLSSARSAGKTVSFKGEETTQFRKQNQKALRALILRYLVPEAAYH